eukprot:14508639-Alexandrium_andersonii.AAC.1
MEPCRCLPSKTSWISLHRNRYLTHPGWRGIHASKHHLPPPAAHRSQCAVLQPPPPPFLTAATRTSPAFAVAACPR